MALTTSPYAPDTAIYLQDECDKHRYIRSKDASAIVERPERLRALKLGIGAAIARVEAAGGVSSATTNAERRDIGEDISAALGRLSLARTGQQQQQPCGAQDPFPTHVLAIVKPDLILNDLTQHPAVRMVHAATDDDAINDSFEHLNRLATWASESEERIRSGKSEIPDGFPQGDLYSEISAFCFPNGPKNISNGAT